MNIKHVIVTGATGYIGKYVVKELVAKDIHCLLYTSDAADE